MNIRLARKLVLTLIAVRSGFLNYCNKKPKDRPDSGIMTTVDLAWAEWVCTMRIGRDVAFTQEPGVDWLVTFEGDTFGVYMDASTIPPVRPNYREVGYYVCVGVGDCPTWVTKTYGLIRPSIPVI
jgi:hypothetical protein